MQVVVCCWLSFVCRLLPLVFVSCLLYLVLRVARCVRLVVGCCSLFFAWLCWCSLFDVRSCALLLYVVRRCWFYCCLMVVACCLLFVDCCSLFVLCWSLFVVCCLLFVCCMWLLVVRGLFSVGCRSAFAVVCCSVLVCVCSLMLDMC